MTHPPRRTIGGLARLSRALQSFFAPANFGKGARKAGASLKALVAKAERRGVGSLAVDELQRLPMLYRAALSSLSVARTIALDRNLLLYLENLSLRAFLMVYGPRQSLVEGARDFLFAGFPPRCALRAGKF